MTLTRLSRCWVGVLDAVLFVLLVPRSGTLWPAHGGHFTTRRSGFQGRSVRAGRSVDPYRQNPTNSGENRGLDGRWPQSWPHATTAAVAKAARKAMLIVNDGRARTWNSRSGSQRRVRHQITVNSAAAGGPGYRGGLRTQTGGRWKDSLAARTGSARGMARRHSSLVQRLPGRLNRLGIGVYHLASFSP